VCYREFLFSRYIPYRRDSGNSRGIKRKREKKKGPCRGGKERKEGGIGEDE